MHAVSGNDVLVNLSIMHLFFFPTLAARTYLKEVFIQSTHGLDESDEPDCCLAILRRLELLQISQRQRMMCSLYYAPSIHIISQGNDFSQWSIYMIVIYICDLHSLIWEVLSKFFLSMCIYYKSCRLQSPYLTFSSILTQSCVFLVSGYAMLLMLYVESA